MKHSALPLSRSIPAVALLAASSLPAQWCPNFGGHAEPARIVHAPFTVSCGTANPPAWTMFVPAHRAPGRKPGFAPGNACELPCLLVTWRCTGLWLLPYAPATVRTMGYVVDQPDGVCGGNP